jgi:hypothetical protein
VTVDRDRDLGTGLTVGHPPDAWTLARVTRSVAAMVERRGWDQDTARELLAMLGVEDAVSVKLARSGLRASRLARLGIGQRTVHHTHRSFHLRDRPMVLVRTSPPKRELGPMQGPKVPLCRRGLHELIGDNRITRPDKSGGQCRECTITRKRRDRELAARLKAEYLASVQSQEEGS